MLNGISAEKIIQMKSLTPEVRVDVQEHNSLNISKGTFYTRDISMLNDNEILVELKDSNPSITEIRRLKKRDTTTKKLTNEDLGVYIVTFNTTELPEKILLGFQYLSVRPYIPFPLRCFKCFKFGHTSEKFEQINKVCPHCSEADHTVIGVHGERAKCERTAKCVNCNQPHNSFSKECVIYKKEYAIQTIRITRKVSFFEARKIYSRENPETIYAKTVKNCTCVCNCTRSNEKIQGEQQSNQREKSTTSENSASNTTMETLNVTKMGKK